MSYNIDGKLVIFNQDEFKRLLREEDSYLGKISTDELKTLLSRKNPVATRDEVIEFLRWLRPDIKSKYKKIIKYVIFQWPNMIPPNKVVPKYARMPFHLSFKNYFDTQEVDTDFADLIYGGKSARTMKPYDIIVNGFQPRQADHLNNASNLGKGEAFQTNWGGSGTLDANAHTVTASLRLGQAQNQWKAGVTENVRNAHINGLLGTRYNPANVFNLQNKKVEKDTLRSRNLFTEIVNNEGNPLGKNAEERFWAHAKWIKSIRSACKGGIAMVASSPLYTRVNARVHFVLDVLGDLGMKARKDLLRSEENYVAITTSELCFCFRYWMNSEFPLKEVVFFYVNGFRVHPPWEVDWSITGADGKIVSSNQEAWLRYGLFLEVMGSAKPFPKFDIGQDNFGNDEDGALDFL